MSNVTGLKELLEALKGLDRSMAVEARAMANAGAQVIRREAVNIAKAQGLVDTGALVKNIAVKRERGTPKNIFEYHIGVRHGKAAKAAERIATRSADGKISFSWTNNPFYWWFWEFGHYNGFLRRHVAAKPFIRPAMSTKQAEALEAMRAKGAARLEKYTAKALA